MSCQLTYGKACAQTTGARVNTDYTYPLLRSTYEPLHLHIATAPPFPDVRQQVHLDSRLSRKVGKYQYDPALSGVSQCWTFAPSRMTICSRRNLAFQRMRAGREV